jgi:hypothetical protein
MSTRRFGKYKGQPLADVPADYLAFLLAKADLFENTRRDFEAELARRHHATDSDEAPAAPRPEAPGPVGDLLTDLRRACGLISKSIDILRRRTVELEALLPPDAEPLDVERTDEPCAAPR